MKLLKQIRFGTAAVLIVLLASPLLAQVGMDRSRLDRDINIMEGILDRLLNEKESHLIIDGSTHGLYLDGYGMLFYTEQSGRFFMTNEYNESLGIYEDQLQTLEQAIQDQAVVLGGEEGDTGEKSEVTKEEAKKEAEKAKKLAETYVQATREKRAEREKQREAARTKAIESMKTQLEAFFKKYASAIGQLKGPDHITVLINLKNWD